MPREYYDYKGEKLTQAEISRRTGINRTTLADWYKRTGDMDSAVEGALRIQSQRSIEFNGENLALMTIAKRVGVKYETLKKRYEETGDVYEAVKLSKESKEKRLGDILYKGKMMTALAIANMEGLDAKSLRRHLEETGDIEEAVKITKEARDLHRGTVSYQGEVMSITAIAKKEGLKHETLKEYYDLYGNIDKAVMITREAQLKRKEALLRGKKASLEELAKYFGMSTIKLDKMIKEGYSPDDIERKQKRGTKKEDQRQYDDTSLYRYCLDHSYNYWVILYLINSYGKTPEEAVEGYVKNGQQIPTKWIYEKYGVLFKHLVLKYGLDSNRLVKIMKDNNCSIEDAITELVFITNNDSEYKKAEVDWLKELYPFLKGLSSEEYEEAIKEFYVDERELKFLREKDQKIVTINRQLLLFEFSQIIDIWPREELLEMLDLYNVSENERKTIVLDLYKPFNNGVIDIGEERRKEALNRMVLNKEIPIDNLPEKDKEYIKDKRRALEIINPQGSSINTNIVK